MPDPSLHTISHTSEASGRTGEFSTGLWKWRPGRPSGPPDASTPQSVLNAVARLIYRLMTRDHITDALISLHWLQVPEGIQYKLAVLAYKVLHGDTPLYLGPLTCTNNLPGRRPLRSTNSNHLVIQPVKLSTVGSQAFMVAAPHIWNRLPTDFIMANSLSTFHQLLKRFLFRQSYPDIVY